MSNFVPTDTLASAVSYVRREFGETGYSVRVVSAGYMVSVFELCASDGGRRLYMVDRYGNVELAPDGLEESGEWLEWANDAHDSLYARRNGEAPHRGHYSQLGGTWWCDTCDSPYCELA
jgi:hypothetical protein